jgi:DNA-directed RNA polymerase subunit N (RpoN/RPB10)
MAAFIQCPSCGFCIGKYTEFFDYAKQALYNDTVFAEGSKYRDFDPEKLAINPGPVPSSEHIFEALGIKNRCCRMRMTTKTEFDRQYK